MLLDQVGLNPTHLCQLTNVLPIWYVSLGNWIILGLGYDWNCIQIKFKFTFLISIHPQNPHPHNEINYIMSKFNQKVLNWSKEIKNNFFQKIKKINLIYLNQDLSHFFDLFINNWSNLFEIRSKIDRIWSSSIETRSMIWFWL